MISAEATLSNYTAVRVIHGDLTATECEAIVSSSGCDLAHQAGVCHAIANACGQRFKDLGREYVKQNGEIKVTQAYAQKAEGKLADNGVAYVIHAIAPGQCPEIKDLVKKTIMNALMEADKLKCSTVALPAICSGIMKVPMDICAECYCSAIEEFGKEKAAPAVLRIDFVVDNKNAFTEIEKVLKKIPAPPSRVSSSPVADANDLVEGTVSGIADLTVSDASDLPQTDLPQINQPSGICGICMDDFDDPETLPCSHTFCRECLAELSLSPFCPTCKAAF